MNRNIRNATTESLIRAAICCVCGLRSNIVAASA
jgi:hypothetical protein